MGSAASIGSTEFLIQVKTADRLSAGTSASVVLALEDSTGKRSNDIKLEKRLFTGFKRGTTESFKVTNTWGLSRDITAMEVWQDGAGANDKWLVEKIEVAVLMETGKGKSTAIFPVNTWLSANLRMRYREFNCALPQHDPNHEQRRHQLESERLLYQYGGPPGLPRKVGAVQTINSCTSQPDVCQCLVAQLEPWIPCQKIIQALQLPT